MSDLWSVPPLFEGRTVALIATGPSLKQSDVDLIRSAGLPAVAINNGFEYAPWADMLYACDNIWWDTYWMDGVLGGPGARDFKGIKVGMAHGRDSYGRHLQIGALPCPDILKLGFGGDFGYDPRPDYVCGNKNSGCMGAQIIAKARAKTILLLGCDCKAGPGEKLHCFGDHPFRVGRNPPPFDDFVRGWNELAEDLFEMGIRVINCSPDSAVTCFPVMSVSQALKEIDGGSQ